MYDVHFAPCVLAPLGPRRSDGLGHVLNPLRSEEEAFRFLLYALAVIVAVIVAILVLRAVL
jgi:hypothetical protein